MAPFRHCVAYPQHEPHPSPPSTISTSKRQITLHRIGTAPICTFGSPRRVPRQTAPRQSLPPHPSLHFSCIPESETRQTVPPSDPLFNNFRRHKYNYRQSEAPKTSADLDLISRGLGAPSVPAMDHPTGASLHTVAQDRIARAQPASVFPDKHSTQHADIMFYTYAKR